VIAKLPRSPLRIDDMREVSLFEAEQQFDALLAEAETGETIAITRDGRIVACLRPPAPVGSHGDLPRLLQRIVANARSRADRGVDRVPKMSWDELKAGLEAEDDTRFGLPGLGAKTK
jgi:antitoxin (DNA-binding transcriptional repressor) of toxin-antitoxin stability system